jgi:hypothetical protein
VRTGVGVLGHGEGKGDGAPNVLIEITDSKAQLNGISHLPAEDTDASSHPWSSCPPYMHTILCISFSSEKPGAEEWTALEKLKVPLLLNFSQCKLYDKDYYKVIEHCSTVLKSDPGELCNTEHCLYINICTVFSTSFHIEKQNNVNIVQLQGLHECTV